MNTYTPGKHLIATIHSSLSYKLEAYEPFMAFISGVIQKYQLQELGTVCHNFSPAGFTAVICLSESHLSIHTWPEYGKANMDIYLSNHLKDNTDKVEGIFEEIVSFFEAGNINRQEILR